MRTLCLEYPVSASLGDQCVNLGLDRFHRRTGVRGACGTAPAVDGCRCGADETEVDGQHAAETVTGVLCSITVVDRSCTP